VRLAPTVLFTEEQIHRRVAELGAEIGRAFEGREICVVGLMKSCLVFMADMIRAIPLDLTCHFLRASSFREEGSNRARTDIVYSAEIPYEGRDILLLDDIVDTGITLNFVLDHIRERKPRSLKVCALIDKPGDRKIDVNLDWAAFTLKDPMETFLVGYGLDHAEYYRGLPFIGTILRSAPPVEGRKITLSPGG
jgi:hypoxanthine phosphoribosyltransferase